MQVRRLSSRGRCHWEGSVEIVLVFFGGVKKNNKLVSWWNLRAKTKSFLQPDKGVCWYEGRNTHTGAHTHTHRHARMYA